MCPSEVIDDCTSAGYRLRCAREGLSLSMRDVAGALNLLVSHVRAIEANRCDVLADDQLLLRLHDYASLVDLDAKEVVDSYRTQSAAISEPIQPQLAEEKQRHTGTWMVVGALATVCVSLGTWLLSQHQTLPSDSSDTAPMRNDRTEDKLANAPRLLTHVRPALNMPANTEITPVDDTVSPPVTNTDPVETNPGKNAVHTVGATPLKKALGMCMK